MNAAMGREAALDRDIGDLRQTISWKALIE